MLIVNTDATNADVETRKYWITLAKQLDVPVRCIYLTAPPHLCQHNDAVRAFGGDLVCNFFSFLAPLFFFRSARFFLLTFRLRFAPRPMYSLYEYPLVESRALSLSNA